MECNCSSLACGTHTKEEKTSDLCLWHQHREYSRDSSILLSFTTILSLKKRKREKKKSLFAYCHDKPQSYIEKEPTLVVLLKDSMDVFRLPLNAMKRTTGTRLDLVRPF